MNNKSPSLKKTKKSFSAKKTSIPYYYPVKRVGFTPKADTNAYKKKNSAKYFR